jgi:hypothetical protein
LRTAAVVGTATAVSKGVSGSMDASAQAKAAQQQAQMDAAAQNALAQQQAQIAQQAAPAAPAAAPAEGDMMTKLTELAKMKEAGFLTDEEFSAAKAKLLA